MTRRLRVGWPDRRLFERRGGSSIRLLAVSDEPDPALDDTRNREALGPIDVIVGAGDLPADYLNFLGDAFHAPVVRVLGNHDRTEVDDSIGVQAPQPVRGRIVEAAGLPVLGLSWPGRPPLRNEGLAWRQAIRVALPESFRRRPIVVVSHIPPRGAGDVATDSYHIGSPGYRWLLDRLKPPLWLHGHTPLAGIRDWRHIVGDTTLANVTGSVFVELVPGAEAPAAGGRDTAATPDSPMPRDSNGASADLAAGDEGDTRGS